MIPNQLGDWLCFGVPLLLVALALAGWLFRLVGAAWRACVKPRPDPPPATGWEALCQQALPRPTPEDRQQEARRYLWEHAQGAAGIALWIVAVAALAGAMNGVWILAQAVWRAVRAVLGA